MLGERLVRGDPLTESRRRSSPTAKQARPPRKKSGESVQTKFLWHDAFHNQVGLERRHLWFLTRQDSHYTRDEFASQLSTTLEQLGVRSYYLWELFGDRDFLLSAWLPPRVDASVVATALYDCHLRSHHFAIEEVLRHWMWVDVALDSTDFYRGVSVAALAEINSPSIPESVRKDYVDKGYIRRVATGPKTLKFFIFIKLASELEIEVRKKLERRIHLLAERFSATHLKSWSFYRLSGDFQYVVSGRVEPSAYESIMTEFNVDLNSESGMELVGASTATHIATTSEPQLRFERIEPFSLDLSLSDTAATLQAAAQTTSPTTLIESLLVHPEGTQLEVKGSAQLDIRRKLHTGETRREEFVLLAIIKTITAFMNTEGGTVVIGALEDAEFYQDLDLIQERLGSLPRLGDYHLIGVQEEYGKKGFDGFELGLRDAISSRVDPNRVVQHSIQFQKVPFDAKDLCLITVFVADEPVYAIEDKGETYRFYVRQGNRSTELKGTERDGYLRSRLRRGGSSSSEQ